MKKIYLASPYFNAEELAVYKETIRRLRAAGYAVFVPQEHEIPNAWDYSNAVWAQKVFEMDAQAILDCDTVMVLNFGMYSDSGTAWEAGYAAALHKDVVQVLCGYDNATYSLMMIGGCRKVVAVDNVENWEEVSAAIDLDKIIQK